MALVCNNILINLSYLSLKVVFRGERLAVWPVDKFINHIDSRSTSSPKRITMSHRGHGGGGGGDMNPLPGAWRYARPGFKWQT